MSSIAARSQLALRLSFFLRRKRTSFGVQMQCPLWVKSGHQGQLKECLLYPQKQTLELSRVMSALCQKRTFCAAAETGAIRLPRRRARAESGGQQARMCWPFAG